MDRRLPEWADGVSKRDGLDIAEQDALCAVCSLASPYWDEQNEADMAGLERLQRKGLVEKADGLWRTTEKGTRLVSNWMNDDI